MGTVGTTMKCPECGAILRSDYQFCNICGHRFSKKGDAQRKTMRIASSGPPRIIDKDAVPAQRAADRSQLPRRTLLIVLLTVLAMSPLTPWAGTFDGMMGVQSIAMDLFVGRYIALLAFAGMVIVLSDRFVHSLWWRRTVLAGIGAGAVLLTSVDIFRLYDLQCVIGSYSSWFDMSIGPGMYLTLAAGVALMAATLLPQCHGTVRSMNATSGIRPGSPGSGL